MINRFDTQTGYLLAGERRCDHRYKDFDDYGDGDISIYSARCTRPATLRIRVTPAETAMSVDGSATITYTPLPDEACEAMSCRACYGRGVVMQGKQGYEAKIEALEG